MKDADESRELRRQQRHWGRHAESYDSKVAKAERSMLAGTREWVGERAAGRVLEVAIGSGRSLPFYRRDVSLVGVDLSPEMLAIARRRAAELGRPVDLREGNAEALPFDDASFDTVVCALALCSIPRPAVAVAEMARVVAPGGSVVVVDHVRSDRAVLFAGQWMLERFTIPLQGEHLTRRHRGEVEAAGLAVVEDERLHSGSVERIRAVREATT
ncbi:class I SAM-dependent methyltransferase [Leifsonia shinshuensis]|uniref:class I SAM-dependent methyltransferase n=1 Tax=Leifsonia shinshuensis TaxID=150026 RepID=UPI00285CF27C|nr:class I SAM-dependent methyltransferase [Leifsonia shinshuensis]MDR6971246.1 ubiquinone/menaquinone biosynthesis C-methylase UbiE [Leifsonia shinshuensis]